MKVTIITPVYNAGDSIERTIKSVIAQNYNDLEYIIVDGGSTDHTLDVISQYKGYITMVISEKDYGIADAYNKGIRIATGEIIGIIAADDELTKNAIHKLVKQYDGQSDVIAGSVIRHNGDRYKIVSSSKDLDKLRTYTSIRHPATFIRKEAYKRYGLYSTEFKCAIDRELMLRYLVKGARFQIVDYPFTVFNVGGISTFNPIKYAYPEDKKISILYGKSKMCTQSFFLKSIFHYYSCNILKILLNYLPIISYIYTYYNKKKYLKQEEIWNLIIKD